MAVYYVDKNRGNDNNNGLSPTSAWQNLEKIDDTAYGSGTAFLLADDSVWAPAITSRVVPPTSWSGTQDDPIVIGKYSPLSASNGNPTVKWHHDTAEADWSATGTPNIWVYSNPGNWTFTNSCLMRLGNTWSASAVDTETSPGTLSQVDGRFYANPSNSTVYLYAPSNPVAYYGSVKMSPAITGYFTLSSGRNWVTIQDILFRETGCGINLFSGDSNTASYIVQRVKGKTVSNLINYSGTTGGVLKAWIRECNISDFGSTAIKTAGTAGMSTLEIYNNRIDDGVNCWSQAAIYITSRATSFTPKIYGNYISNCRWGTRDKTVDGCAIYTETASDQCEVYSNLIEDCYMALQDNSGRKATFYGNVINRCWSAIRVSDQAAVGSTDHNFYNNTCLIGYDGVGPGTYGTAIASAGVRVFKSSGGSVALNIRNNIFHHMSGVNSSAAILLPQVSYTGSLNNNWFSNYTYDAKLEFSPETVTNTTKTGTGNPEVYPDFKPRNAKLFNGGANLGGTDFNGASFPSSPSIGAVQCVGAYPKATYTDYESVGDKESFIRGRGRRR